MLDKILVLDMDAYGSIAVARKLRAARIYCKILPGDASLSDVIEQDASGIIWVGGAEGHTELIDGRILDMDVPLLALGSAAEALARMQGGTSHGAALVNETACVKYDAQMIFDGLNAGDRWFARADGLELSGKLMPIAEAEGCIVGFCDKEKPLYGLQFTIEKHDPEGATLLINFSERICRCTAWWSIEAFIDRSSNELARLAGDGPLYVALSGGTDSSVCAALGKRAVGDRLRPVMVRTGLHRNDVEGQAEAFCRQNLGVELMVVDARDMIYNALKGQVAPEAKSEAVRGVFRAAMLRAVGDEARESTLILGTNYSEVLAEHCSARQRGELLEFGAVVEPLVELFKDEVRLVGEALRLPGALVGVQPIAIEGLASRIEGEVTEELVETLRTADAMYREEIETAGQDKRLQQYYGVLGHMMDNPKRSLLLKAIAMGDKAGAARLPYDLLERVAERVRQKLPCIGRVIYDLTPTW